MSTPKKSVLVSTASVVVAAQSMHAGPISVRLSIVSRSLVPAASLFGLAYCRVHAQPIFSTMRTISFTHYQRPDVVFDGPLKSETNEPGNAQQRVLATCTDNPSGSETSATTADCASAVGATPCDFDVVGRITSRAAAEYTSTRCYDKNIDSSACSNWSGHYATWISPSKKGEGRGYRLKVQRDIHARTGHSGSFQSAIRPRESSKKYPTRELKAQYLWRAEHRQ